MAVHIKKAVRAQGLNHAGIVDGAREHDLIRGSRHDLGMERRLLRLVVAQHHQLDPTTACREGLHDFQDGIFRLSPRNEGGKALWCQVQLTQRIRLR